jgi:hypothetical protein
MTGLPDEFEPRVLGKVQQIDRVRAIQAGFDSLVALWYASFDRKSSPTEIGPYGKSVAGLGSDFARPVWFLHFQWIGI